MIAHDPSNTIHPTAIVEDGVVMGSGNYIGPYCYVRSGVRIGDGNRFEAFNSIGCLGEHKLTLRLGDAGKGLVIGSNNIFREYASVHAGVERDTLIGNGCTIQRNAHVSHDAVIGDTVTLSCSAIVAGHVVVSDGVNMGLGSITHQCIVIPPYVMLGMGTIVTKATYLKPFCVYVGNPARYLKLNHVGMDRSGLSTIEVNAVIHEWNRRAVAA